MRGHHFTHLNSMKVTQSLEIDERVAWKGPEWGVGQRETKVMGVNSHGLTRCHTPRSSDGVSSTILLLREQLDEMKERIDRSDMHQMMFSDSVTEVVETLNSTVGKMLQRSSN